MSPTGTVYLRRVIKQSITLTPVSVKKGDKIQWMQIMENEKAAVEQHVIHNAKIIGFPSSCPTKVIVQNYCEDWIRPLQRVLVRKTRVVTIKKD